MKEQEARAQGRREAGAGKGLAQEMARAPIAEAMQSYAADGALAFHTPGHKQGRGAHARLRALVTEEGLSEEVSLMEELDDLHDPHGAIREAEALAARLYGADAAFFMVNGTTGAIQTMLLAALAPGDAVLVQRNAHRSVLSALVLTGARPVWLAPETDEALGLTLGVAPETVARAAAAHPEAKAAVLVNPTYYGVTTDLLAIAKILHAHDMLLLVDEAHGPHLRFSPALPPQALDCGADMAAQSTHKLLGAMTQGSLLLAKGGRIAPARVREAAALLTTTSPNQLLLASIDIARLQMAETGAALLSETVALAEAARKEINEIPGLSCFGAERSGGPGFCALDVTKLTVSVGGIGLTGPEAESILRHTYKVQCELSDAQNLLFLLSYADTKAETARLTRALAALAKHHARRAPAPRPAPVIPPPPACAASPRTAFFAAKEGIAFQAAEERIAAEEVTFYPPGIPALVPGDLVSREICAYIRAMQTAGLRVVGPEDCALETIRVVTAGAAGDASRQEEV